LLGLALKSERILSVASSYKMHKCENDDVFTQKNTSRVRVRLELFIVVFVFDTFPSVACLYDGACEEFTVFNTAEFH